MRRPTGWRALRPGPFLSAGKCAARHRTMAASSRCAARRAASAGAGPAAPPAYRAFGNAPGFSDVLSLPAFWEQFPSATAARFLPIGGRFNRVIARGATVTQFDNRSSISKSIRLATQPAPAAHTPAPNPPPAKLTAIPSPVKRTSPFRRQPEPGSFRRRSPRLSFGGLAGVGAEPAAPPTPAL